MPKSSLSHQEQLVYLKKIEGQVRGIQNMISEGRYCIDILTQLQSVGGALRRVEKQILRKHIDHCVVDAVRGSSKEESRRKIDEVMDLLVNLRKV